MASKISTMGLSPWSIFQEKNLYLSDFVCFQVGDTCDKETLNSAFSCEIGHILINLTPKSGTLQFSQMFFLSYFLYHFSLFGTLNRFLQVLGVRKGGLEGKYIFL